jgi:hypothetical protein
MTFSTEGADAFQKAVQFHGVTWAHLAKDREISNACQLCQDQVEQLQMFVCFHGSRASINPAGAVKDVPRARSLNGVCRLLRLRGSDAVRRRLPVKNLAREVHPVRCHCEN